MSKNRIEPETNPGPGNPGVNPASSSSIIPADSSTDYGSVSSVPTDNKNSCATKNSKNPRKREFVEPRLYGRRWLMLFIFCLYSATNAFQWLEYATINNVIGRYYNQPSMVVDWLSLIYMAVYIPLIFPANWILDKYGLMPVALLGSFGNALGAWIKVASARSDLFAVTFFGQTICAVSQIFILGIPANLAAVWFGPKEVSKATALGVFGNQVGNALGFLLPPLFVPNPDPWDPKYVKYRLEVMFITIATVTSALFFLVLAVFKGAPPRPPSYAQATKHAEEPEEYFGAIKRLFCNQGFILLFLTYGMNVGTFYAISTLLNQSVLHYFPGEEVNVGRIGLLIVVTGMAGSILIGVWLDKTHTYKATTMVVYVLTLAGMGLFAIILPLGHLWLVFVTAAFFGLFMSSYLPLGFEFAAEILYPASEGITSGLLNASAQVFGIVLTVAGGAMMTNISVQSGILLFCGLLAVGSFLTALIVEDLKRQKAEHKHQKSSASPPYAERQASNESGV